jgi:uridine kinase
MNTITVSFPSGVHHTVPSGTTAASLVENFSEPPSKILAVLVNNEVYSLNSPLLFDAYLEPVLAASKYGASVYRRSLCFLLAAAAHRLFPKSRLLVGHSLGYGYYYTLDTGKRMKQADIDKLKAEMVSLAQQNLQFQTSYLSYKEAIDLFDQLGLIETRKQLNCICPPSIKINTLLDFSDMYFGPLVLSTGYLRVFDLMAYGEGFLLRFPTSSKPDELPEFHDVPTLFTIYKRYKEWGKQLGVTSAASLNELVRDRKIKDFIDIAETLQVKCIADIADQIHERRQVKVVLIAGPSSSGKTTTSKKLALQLQALGYRPKVISLDNYYVGRDRNPKDENGNYDYECLEALDVPLLNQILVDLFDGKEVRLPSYNFAKGERYYDGTTMRLEAQDILVMEGIHGLNDKLTPLVKSEFKFKLYLSALTQLNLDDHNRISTSDNRLIRRIVRDAQFRGKTAADTIAMWDSVQQGERLHIFPFQDNADAMLNTALDYELPVLKVYAEPLLRCVSPLQKEYAEASRLLRFLGNFSPIPPTAVPDRSIIREFIGGSAFHY